MTEGTKKTTYDETTTTRRSGTSTAGVQPMRLQEQFNNYLTIDDNVDDDDDIQLLFPLFLLSVPDEGRTDRQRLIEMRGLRGEL